MSATGEQPARTDAFASVVEMPRLELPKFQLRPPVPRPANPVRPDDRARVATDAVMRTAAVTTTASIIPVVQPLPATQRAAHDEPPVATAQPVYHPIVAAPPRATIAHSSRTERLRSDAMLGLVLGIGAAVIIVAAIVALWANLHGVPPGTY